MAVTGANQNRGLLRIATSLDRTSAIDASGIDVPSARIAQTGRAASVLAGELGQMAQQVGHLADKAAAEEGAEAGALAGLDPEFRTDKSGTIRSEAYDKAGMQIYASRTSAAIADDFEKAYDAHSADPAKLDKVLSEKAAGWTGKVIPEYKADAATLIGGTKLRMMRQATREMHARMAADQKAALQDEMANSLKGISQRAFALGLDPEADAVLAADLDRLKSSLSRTDMTGKRMVDPSRAGEILRAAKQETASARLFGAFERLPSLPEKERFIAGLREDFKASRGLAAEFDLDGMERISGHLEGQMRAARTEMSAASRALREDVANVARMAEKGFAPSSDDMAALKTRALAAEPDVQADLAAAERLMSWQASARRATPAELDQFARQERARLTTAAEPEGVRRLELGERLLDTMRTELKQDPLGWADRVGVLKVAPLDLSSAETAAASLKARIAQSETVAELYGIAPQYLRPDEKQRLATAAAQGGAGTLGIATAIAQGAPDKAASILAEVFDEAPVVAMLGGHVAAAGVTPAARDAADGMALRKTDGFKPMAPSSAEARRQALTAIGGALSELPKSEGAAVALASSIYEVRARRLQLSEFDDTVWQQALNEALGAREVQGERYGGVVYQNDNWGADTGAVVIPPNVKASGFRDLVEAIRIEDFSFDDRPRTSSLKPAGQAELRRAKLKSAGDGQYFLALGDPEGDAPDWLLDSGGNKYVLDLQALEPQLRRRRPDLYLGGR
jgi:hypothetical protein